MDVNDQSDSTLRNVETADFNRNVSRISRRSLLLITVLGAVFVVIAGLSYFWLKPGVEPEVTVRVTDPIFELKTDDLRGLSLDLALRKVDYPDVVYKFHVGQVWINNIGDKDRTPVAIPPVPADWTVAAVCFRVSTLEVTEANEKIAPGEVPIGNFVTFGIVPTSGMTPELRDQIGRRSLDESLSGCSLGVSEMRVYRPDGGRIVKVN